MGVAEAVSVAESVVEACSVLLSLGLVMGASRVLEESVVDSSVLELSVDSIVDEKLGWVVSWDSDVEIGDERLVPCSELLMEVGCDLMLDILVIEGSRDDCVSELVEVLSLVGPSEPVVIPEGFVTEVLLLMSGSVKAVDSADVNVEDSENVGSVLIVVDGSADGVWEAESVSDVVEVISDDKTVVRLPPGVAVVVGGASE